MKSGEVEDLFRTESELAFVSRTATLVPDRAWAPLGVEKM